MVTRAIAVAMVVALGGCGDTPATTRPASGPATTQTMTIPPHVADSARGAEGVRDLIKQGRLDPDPARAVESPAEWRVWFCYRSVIKEVDGRQVIEAQDPAELAVVVRKDDMSARLVPGR